MLTLTLEGFGGTSEVLRALPFDFRGPRTNGILDMMEMRELLGFIRSEFADDARKVIESAHRANKDEALYSDGRILRAGTRRP